MKVEYVERLSKELIKDHEVDYVLKSSYPINCDALNSILDIEQGNRQVLNNFYLEFEELPLSGGQIINLCNNLNVNVLLKKVSDQQMEQLLVAYSDLSVRKTVYPVKVVVLLALTFLYDSRLRGEEIPQDIEEKVKEHFERLKFDYIADKYSVEFLTNWTKWYLIYLFEKKRDFIADFNAHCLYLMDYAEAYYNKKEVPRSTTNELASGLYVPLAFVMRDMKFNPYKVQPLPHKFGYVGPADGKFVVQALFPIVNYVKLVEEYLATANKGEYRVDDLDKLTDNEILLALKNKLKIVTKNPITKLDLFPLEVSCS